jgi:hypothetical protein
MKTAKRDDDVLQPEPEIALLPDGAELDKPQAWEMIENGRYQPRRIKGSLLGRELG